MNRCIDACRCSFFEQNLFDANDTKLALIGTALDLTLAFTMAARLATVIAEPDEFVKITVAMTGLMNRSVKDDSIAYGACIPLLSTMGSLRASARRMGMFGRSNMQRPGSASAAPSFRLRRNQPTLLIVAHRRPPTRASSDLVSLSYDRRAQPLFSFSDKKCAFMFPLSSCLHRRSLHMASNASPFPHRQMSIHLRRRVRLGRAVRSRRMFS